MNQIKRRTLLKASGVSIALPMLEAMNPAYGNDSSTSPKRAVFICNTLGLHPPSLWPTENQSSIYLDLLKSHRDDFTLFGGLSHADQLGRQAHDSEMTWLTSAPKPGMDGFRNSISVDQVIAKHFGYTTRFPSIVMGSFQEQSQSYTSGGVMIPAETSPEKLFAKLFLQGKPSEVQAEKHRLSQGKSILDHLMSQTNNLRRRASRSDHHLLNDYLESIRETEQSIGKVQKWLDQPKPTVTAKQPQDIPNIQELIGKFELLLDLIPLIVQTDSTRVISIMIQDHGSLNIKGVNESHHILSHHGQDESKISQLQRIETQILKSFAGLLDQLEQTKENGVRLLDRTSILFGSNLGNANSHDTNNLPILLAGGDFKHAGFVDFGSDKNVPLSNLFLTMLTNMGIEFGSFGQSTGKLSWTHA